MAETTWIHEMKLIAHRGNINGPQPELENSPFYLITAIEKGYDVETDVWYDNDKWYLGHDEGGYQIDREFLEPPNLWCHAKNLNALQSMVEYGIHCFWHQTDDFTLTSKGYIWTFPGKPTCEKTVIVSKDLEALERTMDLNIYAVCSDYVGAAKK